MNIFKKFINCITCEDIFKDKIRHISKEIIDNVKNNIENAYAKRIKENQEVLDSKLEAAKLWSNYVLEEIKDLPKSLIAEIKTFADPYINLESIVDPRVYINIITLNKNNEQVNNTFDVYVNYHRQSDESLRKLLVFIRDLKKEYYKSLYSSDKEINIK